MKVLFICTHNRYRSILAEAIARQRAGALLEPRSAGSQPQGQVDAGALHYLRQHGYNCEGLRSQSWDEYREFDPGLMITLCDAAAGEECPVHFGRTKKLHWGMPDPAKVQGDETEIAAAYTAAILELEGRIDALARIWRQRSSRGRCSAAWRTD